MDILMINNMIISFENGFLNFMSFNSFTTILQIIAIEESIVIILIKLNSMAFAMTIIGQINRFKFNKGLDKIKKFLHLDRSDN